MIRAVVLILSLIFLADSTAFASQTSDPKHSGWIRDVQGIPLRVSWKNYSAKCVECQPLANSYNSVMQQLLEARYQVAWIKVRSQYSDGFGAMQQGTYEYDNKTGKSKIGDELTEMDVADASSKLNERMGLTELSQDYLPDIEKQIGSLEAAAENLQAQLKACEKQCKKKNKDGEEIIGSLPGSGGSVAQALPFPWKGPYPEVCPNCAGLADALNAMPTKALAIMGAYQAAQAQLLNINTQIARIKLLDDSSPVVVAEDHDRVARQDEDDEFTDELARGSEVQEEMQRWKDKSRRKTQSNLEKLKDEKKYVQNQLDVQASDLDNIKRQFKKTLAEYNKCVPTCKKAEAPKTQSCAFAGSDSYPDIVIGPNAEYGTTASMVDGAKSLLGGGGSPLGGKTSGGFGMGGGFGGGLDAVGTENLGRNQRSSKGPKTKRDPLRGERATDISMNGVDMEVKADFNDNGELVVSTKIKDAPGNGTFHAIYLEDEQGRKRLPKEYIIVDIWMDHKLVVKWSKSTYVDGQLVDYQEGGYTEEWREDLGSLALFKKPEDGLWSKAGYEQALGGLRHIAATFEGSPMDLFGSGCGGARLVNYITQPKGDPVVAVPVVVDLLSGGFVPQDTQNKRDWGDFAISLREAF